MAAVTTRTLHPCSWPAMPRGEAQPQKLYLLHFGALYLVFVSPHRPRAVQGGFLDQQIWGKIVAYNDITTCLSSGVWGSRIAGWQTMSLV